MHKDANQSLHKGKQLELVCKSLKRAETTKETFTGNKNSSGSQMGKL